MSNVKQDPALLELAAEIDEISARAINFIQISEKQNLTAPQIDELYRDIHTLKGSCLLFGYMDMGGLAHEIESKLEPVRQNKATLKSLNTEKLIKAFDLFSEFAKKQINTPTADFKEKILQLTNFFKNPQQHSSEQTTTTVKINPAGSINETAAPAAPTQTAQPQDETNTTVRVPVTLLDNLMAMMSEMVLVRNQVLQIASRTDDLDFLNLSQRLDVVTSDLQSEVMKTRMQPIGLVLTKFQRVVRDLSKELGKKIELVLEGTETELDKSLIEAIKDPLTHIVRNACDHGLETIEERKQANKSEVGQILIRSFHEGGQVIVEITDNGRGLNKEKLIKKALEKGIINSEKSLRMSDREANELIFAAGFSTAANVTNISGRGVGMDVVKNNIEKIGGRVELKSEFGKGMTLSLKIPLTLAIVPGLIIKSGQERYAIPQVKLVELVHVDQSDETHAEQIEYVQGKPVFRLRGKLLPLVILSEVLEKNLNEKKSSYNVVVLNADNSFFGLVVDEIHDTADIVVKPMSRFLKNLSIYSGATVLGDGSVSLILDVVGLAKYAHLTSTKPSEDTANHVQEVMSDQQEFLFCKISTPTVHGIPLAVVHRLEEFSWDSFQMSGNIHVVQYRNELLPILCLSEYLGYSKFDPVELSKSFPTCKTVVVKKNSKLFALQVNEILDVISTTNNIDDSLADREGLLGSVLVGGQVSVIINAYDCVEHLVKRMSPATEKKQNIPVIEYNKKTNTLKPADLASVKILLAEDSSFFKRHIGNLLQKNNLSVTIANNGAEALDILGTEHFDLILSDIEMPIMNGLEFVKAVRAQDKFAKIPMLAITTKFSEVYVKEGIAAGFNEYLEKIKEAELMENIFHYLSISLKNKRKDIAV